MGAVITVQAPERRDSEGARVNVFGVLVSATNPPAVLRAIDRAIETDGRGYVCVTGAHGVIESQRDAILKQIHNDAFLVVPDGMPLVWMLKWAGVRSAARVYGPDLMPEVLAQGIKASGQGTVYRHYFYGSTEETLSWLEARLNERFPGIQVVGRFSPPFRPLRDDEVDEIAGRINAAAPHIVWVGLSTPMQERWMHDFRPLLKANLLIGVGAAFDFHAEKLSRAPRFMQRAGLEWLFRLFMEPRRLWRRYFKIVPKFIYLVFRQKILRRDPA
jgi:N-acetylglucosaminyldiphosphoundecaprenol N-acetyl-beta-D-mannosaminyltransferase